MILLFTAHFIYLTWTIFCPRNVYFIIIAIHRLIMTVIYQHYFWRYFKIVNTSQFWQLFPYKIKHLEFHHKYNSRCIIHGCSPTTLVTGPSDSSQAASEDSFVVAILSQLVTSIYNLAPAPGSHKVTNISSNTKWNNQDILSAGDLNVGKEWRGKDAMGK